MKIVAPVFYLRKFLGDIDIVFLYYTACKIRGNKLCAGQNNVFPKELMATLVLTT